MKRTHHLLARQDSKWTSQYKKPCWSSQKTSVVWSAKSDIPHLMWEISDCAREGPEKVLSWPMVETPWLCMTKQMIKSVLLKTRINGALLSHGVSWFLKKKNPPFWRAQMGSSHGPARQKLLQIIPSPLGCAMFLPHLTNFLIWRIRKWLTRGVVEIWDLSCPEWWDDDQSICLITW